MALIDVVAVAPDRRRSTTRAARTPTKHKSGWPERPWPIVSLRTPFFCSMNVSATKVAARRSASGQWNVSKKARTDPQLDVSKAELGTGPVRWGSAKILPGSKQKTDGQDKRCGGEGGRGSVHVREGQYLSDDGKRKRFDATVGFVRLAPGTTQGREANVEFAMPTNQARVWGPQPGVCLAHRSYGILHCPKSYGMTAGHDQCGDSVVQITGGGVGSVAPRW